MHIWGNKTDSLFDIWSIEHFVSGVTIGSIICFFLLSKYQNFQLNLNIEKHDDKNNSEQDIIKNPLFVFNYFVIILLIAYMWEVLEFYMEAGYTNIDKVTYWFQGVEYWANRFITDPLMVLLGSWLGLKFCSKILMYSARSFSAIWVGMHVFLFPNCMYLQNIIHDAIPSSGLIQAKLSDVIIVCGKFISGFLV